VVAGCGDKEAPVTAAAPAPTTTQDVAPAPASTEEVAAAAETASQTLAPTEATWTPEALEALLAPVALYPDVVLGQVLVASTNPQEVLDAGNWLLQNESLKGDALDEAAKQAGFTPPMRGLLQFPETVDMMCQELGWTEELGQAYVNDQAGVLESVQRLRAQAKDVGNLTSSEQLKVETEMQANQEVIIVSPPSPEVVYVPQYDPVAVYAPAPASAVPAATTTTVVEDKDEGHSTGTLVATGLLSFGAGLLVAEIFDDDDDDYYRGGYYNPYYYGRPPPYYPPYPYRPVYGNGYYPSHGYNRPPNYRPGGNNNTVIINQNNNYWNNYGNKPGTSPRTRDIKSPITTAKPNRSDLGALNTEASKGPKRPAPARADSPNVKGTYAGARQPEAGRPAAASVDGAKVQGSYAGAKPKTQGTYAGAKPKTQGSYAGAKPKAPESRSAARPDASPAARPAARPEAKPATRPAANTDRGRPAPQANKQASRPAATPARTSQPSRKTATSGANRGGNDRAASARGKQSMQKSASARPQGGGRKKQG